MNLLVVDFDFFFNKVERPQDSRFPGEWSLFDWGHSEEDPIFFETIWQSRASSFLMNNVPLPEVDRERVLAFWRRFTFAPHAQLLYADSNMYAAHQDVREGVTQVWLFDAHHDCGYQPDAIDRMLSTHEINCENWMLHYAMTDVEMHMRYPQWRRYVLEEEDWGEPVPLVPLDRQVDDDAPVDVVFDRVYVCKSPAWVPSWCDLDWHRFLTRAPFRRKVALDGAKRVREFDREAAQRYADQEREALTAMRATLREGGAERG